MAYFKQFNRWTSPYKNARLEDGGPMVIGVNLTDSALTVRQLKQGSDSAFTWLPAKNGDRDGLLIEWSHRYQIWTVWEFNRHAPYLRRYQVRYDVDQRLHLVVDTEDNDRRVGSAPAEHSAKAIARNMNKNA